MLNKLRTQMRWIMIIVATAFILSSFLMYGSISRDAGTPNGAWSDRVVAEINGRRFMLSTLYVNLQRRVDTLGIRDVTSRDFQAVLEEYAMELQLAQEVRDSGVTVTDAEVEQAMREHMDQAFATRELFHLHLERAGLRLDDYKRILAQQMTRQRFIEESIGIITVEEDEAIEFYDSIKALLFRQPPGYRVNLARFSSEAGAYKLRELLVEGYPWDEAMSHDEVVSSDIIHIMEDPVFFSDVAFDSYLLPMRGIDIGAVSPVFEIANDNFAVGVKSERIEEHITPFDEVSADIRLLLQQQKEREAVTDFARGLLSRATINILDPSLFPLPEDDAIVDTPTDDAD